MADKTIRNGFDGGAPMKHVDMGDGTYAPRYAVVSVLTASGGAPVKKVQAAGTTNATLVKSSAGKILGLEFANQAAYPVFIKIYNSATIPTAGVGVPAMIVAVPAGGSREISRPDGIAFSAGIGYTITKLAADADVTAVAADDVIGSITYF